MRDISDYAFQISVSDDVLADLTSRLDATRWPVAPRGPDWAYGTSLGYMRQLIQYWRVDFDWRAQERQLNAFAHYRVPVNKAHIHVIIEPGSATNCAPLLMLHGWPGSFMEFLPLVQQLAHPERFGGRAEDGVTVVIASPPGYAFSDAPEAPIHPREVAAQLCKMMRQRMGWERFSVHGGDWGAAVASWMAFDFPSAIAGLHLTTAIMQPPLDEGNATLAPEERAYLDARRSRGPWESGYQVIQGTKPLTLAYAHTDSPAGLAAWILEKYYTWSCARDTGQGPPMEQDTLLTIVMLYWLAGPGPAMWMYRFLVDGSGLRLPARSRIEVPTALCLFEGDSSPIGPIEWQRRSYNVVRRTIVPLGSHFPGLNAGEPLIEDLQEFIAYLRCTG